MSTSKDWVWRSICLEVFLTVAPSRMHNIIKLKLILTLVEHWVYCPLSGCSDVGSLSLSATVVLNGHITVSDQRFMVIQTRQRQLQPLQLRKLHHQLLRSAVWTSAAEVNAATLCFCPFVFILCSNGTQCCILHSMYCILHTTFRLFKRDKLLNQ